MALVSALGSGTTNSITDIHRQFNHMHFTNIQLKPFHKQLVKMAAPEFMREVFEKALKNVAPNFEVKSRRVGGANYQIPFPVAGHRQLHFAYSWLVQAARARNGMPYAQRLALEIIDAHNEAGAAYKKKEDTHKMAEANRAFAHFARG